MPTYFFVSLTDRQSIYYFFSEIHDFLSGYDLFPRFKTWLNGPASYLILNLLNLREFVTTDTELKAMAPAAIMGLRSPSAARGIARTL